MDSRQERLNLKGNPCNTWSIREQLCLASSVLKSSDRNWMSVSRGLNSFYQKQSQRPPDWFSTKSCAAQYAILLQNLDTPEREENKCIETTGQSIVRRLTQERIKEICQILAFQRDEYQQLKSDLKHLKSRKVSEEDLKKMCLQLELAEQESEQKLNTHTACLVKRQEEVEQIPQSLNLAINKESESSDDYVISVYPSSGEKEDKKNEGGRSLLLNSLLKPQLSRRASSQLHQLAPTSIVHEAPEGSSAEASNISMLLQLPEKLQRTTLPNKEPHVSNVNLSQQNANLQMMQMEKDTENVQIIEPTLASGHMSDSEIIDHIDKVIAEEKKVDVLDNDEINEIIGDIEELIKEEIAENPQILDLRTAEVMESLISQPPLVTGRHSIKIVPTKVSLLDSPDSEIDIENIDASNSNIAEMIGVAVENIPPQESEEVESTSEEKEAETSLKSREELNEKGETAKTSKLVDDSKVGIESKAAENKEQTTECTINCNKKDADKASKEDLKKSAKEDPETYVKDDIAKSPKEDVAELLRKDLKETVEDTKNSAKDDAMKETIENTKGDVLQVLKNSPLEKLKMTSEKESSRHEKVAKDTEEADRNKVDQLEMILAKITGHQAALSTEVLSVSSHDPPSREDTERSQDIILILEHEEILPIHEKKKVDEEVLVMEHAADSKKPSTSSEEGSAIIKEGNGKDTLVKGKEEAKEVVDLEMENSKRDDGMEFLYIATNTAVIEDDAKDLEIDVQEKVEESDPLKETEELASEEGLSTNEGVEQCHQETSSDEGPKKEEMKEEKDKINMEFDADVKKQEKDVSASIGELYEEESTMRKLSRGKIMKTYSKKQTIDVESEPEMEGSKESADYRAWKKAVMLVYDRLATHKYSSVFLKPITQEQVPGYHSIIFRPMDLTTIKKNIDNGTIRSTRHFQKDVMLMCQNAIMYNKRDSFVYRMAVTMQEEFLEHMQILLQVTGEVSFYRETRTPANSSRSELSESVVKKKRSYVTPSPHETSGNKRRKSANE